LSEQERGAIEVREEYGGWTPPIDFRYVVNRLLRHVPEQYLGGISTVILTDSRTLNRARRRRKRRVKGKRFRLSEGLGIYHGAWQGQPAWIELFADRIVANEDKRTLRFPLFRDTAVGEVLFHEIGHHIHATKCPQHQEPEDVADQWRRKLHARFMRRQYWYLVPVTWILRPAALVYYRYHKQKAAPG
jgi:hypothetical protein